MNLARTAAIEAVRRSDELFQLVDPEPIVDVALDAYLANRRPWWARVIATAMALLLGAIVLGGLAWVAAAVWSAVLS